MWDIHIEAISPRIDSFKARFLSRPSKTSPKNDKPGVKENIEKILTLRKTLHVFEGFVPKASVTLFPTRVEKKIHVSLRAKNKKNV